MGLIPSSPSNKHRSWGKLKWNHRACLGVLCQFECWLRVAYSSLDFSYIVRTGCNVDILVLHTCCRRILRAPAARHEQKTQIRKRWWYKLLSEASSDVYYWIYSDRLRFRAWELCLLLPFPLQRGILNVCFSGLFDTAINRVGRGDRGVCEAHDVELIAYIYCPGKHTFSTLSSSTLRFTIEQDMSVSRPATVVIVIIMV